MVEGSEHIGLHRGRQVFWLHTDVLYFTLWLIQGFLEAKEIFLHANHIREQPLVALLDLS